MGKTLFGSSYSRMDQVEFFKGYLQQILLGLFSNTLTNLLVTIKNGVYHQSPNEPSYELQEVHTLSLSIILLGTTIIKGTTLQDVLRDLVPFAQLKKNVKNIHGGVLLLVKLQALAILKVSFFHGRFHVL